MAKIFSRIQRPSLRWGLICGIILGVIGIAIDFAAIFITDVNIQSLLSYTPAVLFLVLGFYAGLRASQETGKWTSGLAAGIWVGVFGALIVGLLTIANTFINMQSIIADQRQYIQMNPSQFGGLKPSDYTASDVIITALLAVFVSIGNAAVFTTVGGALGGFTGRRRALAVAQRKAYEESFSEAPVAEGTAGAIEEQDSAPASAEDEALPSEINNEVTR